MHLNVGVGSNIILICTTNKRAIEAMNNLYVNNCNFLHFIYTRTSLKKGYHKNTSWHVP